MNQYLDDGRITETVDFDWTQFEPGPATVSVSLRATEMTLECQRQIWVWIYQPPCQDLDGFLCRCIVATWIFNPLLRTISLTEIAGRFGKKKQSLGRWVEDFKRQFPQVCKHLQHIRTPHYERKTPNHKTTPTYCRKIARTTMRNRCRG